MPCVQDFMLLRKIVDFDKEIIEMTMILGALNIRNRTESITNM